MWGKKKKVRVSVQYKPPTNEEVQLALIKNYEELLKDILVLYPHLGYPDGISFYSGWKLGRRELRGILGFFYGGEIHEAAEFLRRKDAANFQSLREEETAKLVEKIRQGESLIPEEGSDTEEDDHVRG